MCVYVCVCALTVSHAWQQAAPLKHAASVNSGAAAPKQPIKKSSSVFGSLFSSKKANQ